MRGGPTKKGWPPPALLLLAAVACGDGVSGPPDLVCTAEAVFGLDVRVLDGSGAPAAEGAVGIAVEGAFADTLVRIGPDRMAGAVERPGTYDVSVSKPGHRTWTATNVTVTEGECHVIPVGLEAVLVPAP